MKFSTAIRSVIVLVISTGLTSVAQTTYPQEIRTTLCELANSPEGFNHEFVQLRAEYISKFQWAGFVDDRCAAKIPVGTFHVLDDLKPEQGWYAFTTVDDDHTHPELLTWKPIEMPRVVRLIRDDNYHAFNQETRRFQVSVAGWWSLRGLPAVPHYTDGNGTF